MHNWKATIVFSLSEVKEQHRKRSQMMSDSSLNFFENIALDLSVVQASCLSHFEFIFSDLKPDGCVN
jgi:hypothetical protein